MESIASADLIELVLIQRESITAQLQFWLSATFAVIVATFVAGSKLSARYRISIAVLYTLATLMTFAGWITNGRELLNIYTELQSRGLSIEAPWTMALLQLLIIIIGTAVTLLFLFQNSET